MSPQLFEEAIRKSQGSSGQSTPRENKMFDKVQAGVTKEVTERLVGEHLKQKRLQTATRERV